MSLNDRWDSRKAQDQAARFLRTGSTQSIYLPPVFGAPRAGCGSSSNCASGFYCRSGYCVKKEATGSGTGGNPEGGFNNSSGGGTGGGGAGGGSTCDGSSLPPDNVGQSPVADGSGGDTGCGGGSLAPCGDPGGDGGGGAGGGNSGGGACGGGALGGSGSVGDGGGGYGGVGGVGGGCFTGTCGEDPGGDGGGGGGGGGDDGVPLEGPNGGAGGDCCGTRCCRYFSTGASGLGVQCFCGPCPPKQRCDKFCSAFSAANGRDAAGCPSSINCDECSECVEWRYWAFCEPKQTEAPCHCGGNNSCKDCEVCNKEGTCEPDCVNCVKQVVVQNTCPGGCQVTARCSVSPCEGPAAECQLQKCIDKACRDNPCPPEYCQPSTTESSNDCNPGLTPPACPPGLDRTGVISVGDQVGEDGQPISYAYSCSICSKTTENKECRCKEPCNCHSDCGDCQLCTPDGCIPDSKCPDGAGQEVCPAPVQPGAEEEEPPAPEP